MNNKVDRYRVQEQPNQFFGSLILLIAITLIFLALKMAIRRSRKETPRLARTALYIFFVLFVIGAIGAACNTLALLANDFSMPDKFDYPYKHAHVRWLTDCIAVNSSPILSYIYGSSQLSTYISRGDVLIAFWFIASSASFLLFFTYWLLQKTWMRLSKN